MTKPSLEELTSLFLPRLQYELRVLWAATGQTAADRQPVELDQQSACRLSRMYAMQQKAMATAQEVRRTARVRALEAATLRIEAGDFGWCDDCGGFIGMPRLERDPTVLRCTRCEILR